MLFSLISHSQIGLGGLKNKFTKKEKVKTEQELANESEGSDILDALGRKSYSFESFLKKSNKRYFDFFSGNTIADRDSLFNRAENHTWDASQIESYKSYVIKINAFYDENSKSLLDKALTEIIPYYDKAEFWTSGNRLTAEFEEETTSWSTIKSALTAIGIAKNHCEDALSFAPDHVEIKNQYALVKTRYEDLNTFVESGEFDKLLVRKKVEEIDEIRMAKPGSTSSSNLALATKNAQAELSEGEKVLRTVITSTHWVVRKNNQDFPINKIMYYQIAYKDAEGNCRLGKGYLIKTYEGGGNYASAHANYAGSDGRHNGAINCDNVNK
ncbi:MAG: hypothetical protein ACI8ZM_001049 [Crocinitomix sp.]|jgi:hypothetical protein